MIPIWYHLNMVRSINKETDVAIRVLKFVAKFNGQFNVEDLSNELNLSIPFLRKILQILAKNGILFSKKGKNGGFLLARDPKKIFLIDIVNIFQNGIEFLNCIDEYGNECPDIKTCLLRKKLLDLEIIMKNNFSSTSIFDLI